MLAMVANDASLLVNSQPAIVNQLMQVTHCKHTHTYSSASPVDSSFVTGCGSFCDPMYFLQSRRISLYTQDEEVRAKGDGHDRKKR